jgi:adenylate kinase family enzyme
MDGNYDSTLDIRIKKADTIIFFDFPRSICLYNTFKRALRGKVFKVTRSDIKEGCEEKLDWTFLKWIWKFNKEVRPEYLEKLNKLEKEKKIIIFRDYGKVDKFLNKLM